MQQERRRHLTVTPPHHPHRVAIVTASALALLATACKPLEKAPPDLDTVLHTLWDETGDGSDEALATAAFDLATLSDAEALARQHEEGSQSRLTEAQLDEVDLYPPDDDDGSWTRPDPAMARPMYLYNAFDCERSVLERDLSAPHQDRLYPGNYDSYERRYTSDREAFLAGEADTVTWEVDLTASNIATGSYAERLIGGLRRVPLADPPEATSADAPRIDDTHALVARTWIPYPADFDNDNRSFTQDYQIEIYLPVPDGRMVHLYGIWREMDLGSLGDMEGDAIPQITLNNLLAWDRQTADNCDSDEARGEPGAED